MHQYKSKEQRCREELAEIGAELVSWSPIVVRIPKDQLDVKLAAKVILHRYDVIGIRHIIHMGGGGGGGGCLMPCGHPRRMLNHCVAVCSLDCDLKPHCTKCGSIDLEKHSFGDDAPGRWHNERMPKAVRCRGCGEVHNFGI